MKNNLIFSPKKGSTRIEYLEMTFGIIGFLIIISLIGPILKPKTFNESSSNHAFFIVMGSIYMIFNLTRKIYNSVEINYEKKEVEILYLTLFKNNCKINIPFEKLKFEYKTHISGTTKKWTLKMWSVNKLVFKIKQGDNGFKKEKLDEIFEHLSKIE